MYGAGAGVDSVWEQDKLEARKMLVNRAESPASSASRNDGGRSFSTKERLVIYQKRQRNAAIFEEKSAFFTLSG